MTTEAPAGPATGAVIARAISLARATIDGNVWTVRVGDDPRPRPVLLAGTGKFDALWARDASYACLGALAAGRLEAVKGTLETLLEHQFPSGLIPRRIGKGSTEWNALLYGLGIHRRRSPHFDCVDRESPAHRAGISGVLCPDTNLLLPHVAAEYVARTGDGAFLDWSYPRLEKAMAWLATVQRDGLIDQEPISDWKDTADRGRVTMYNQALYFQVLRSMADLAERRGDGPAAAKLRDEARDLAARVRKAFWDDAGGFFRDSECVPGFSPDGNLIAVAAGLATPAETARIFARCDAALERNGPLLPAADPLYPADRVPWAVRLVGLRHYHDGFAWPWQDSMHAIAAARAGDRGRAERALAPVAEMAERDRGFFEVYEGNPPRIVKRIFYVSEPGFSWSAGLFLRACAEIGLPL